MRQSLDTKVMKKKGGTMWQLYADRGSKKKKGRKEERRKRWKEERKKEKDKGKIL